MRIEERALKLFRWESAAITCAGEAESIYTFVHLFNDALGHGCAAPEALERAATSITGPHAPPRFEGLVATFTDGEPRLFTFNKEKDARITEVRGTVHLGIADRDLRRKMRSRRRKASPVLLAESNRDNIERELKRAASRDC